MHVYTVTWHKLVDARLYCDITYTSSSEFRLLRGSTLNTSLYCGIYEFLLIHEHLLYFDFPLIHKHLLLFEHISILWLHWLLLFLCFRSLSGIDSDYSFTFETAGVFGFISLDDDPDVSGTITVVDPGTLLQLVEMLTERTNASLSLFFTAH